MASIRCGPGSANAARKASANSSAVVARRVVPPLDAALVREAALALQEQLHALAAALLALGPGVARH